MTQGVQLGATGSSSSPLKAVGPVALQELRQALAEHATKHGASRYLLLPWPLLRHCLRALRRRMSKKAIQREALDLTQTDNPLPVADNLDEFREIHFLPLYRGGAPSRKSAYKRRANIGCIASTTLPKE